MLKWAKDKGLQPAGMFKQGHKRKAHIEFFKVILILYGLYCMSGSAEQKHLKAPQQESKKQRKKND